LITLAWEFQPESDRLRVEWEERGGPPVEPPRHKGFGSRMIERGLKVDLEGAVLLEYRREGVACTIEFTLTSGATGSATGERD
jgi:two-component sensor histidine kinase